MHDILLSVIHSRCFLRAQVLSDFSPRGYRIQIFLKFGGFVQKVCLISIVVLIFKSDATGLSTADIDVGHGDWRDAFAARNHCGVLTAGQLGTVLVGVDQVVVEAHG